MRADLPRLADLPIPADVRPGPGWTEQMLEMAEAIGAHPTLTIVAALGGQRVFVPQDATRSPFADLVDADTCAKIAWLYGGSRIELPVARVAVDRARRAGVLASVRQGALTVGDAALVIGTSRTYVHALLKAPQERLDAPPMGGRLPRSDPRQLDFFNRPASQD